MLEHINGLKQLMKQEVLQKENGRSTPGALSRTHGSLTRSPHMRNISVSHPLMRVHMDADRAPQNTVDVPLHETPRKSRLESSTVARWLETFDGLAREFGEAGSEESTLQAAALQAQVSKLQEQIAQVRA